MSENKLEIIPVIDLKNGAVVRAKRGNRHLYAPIETKLASTSEPADVVRGLLSLHSFKKIYIADLDAIEGRGDHSRCIDLLETQFPQVGFWLDAGIDSEERARAWLAAHRGELVLGSESLSDARLVEQLRACEHVLLSLDFRGEAQQGPACLFNDEALWPRRIIAMTLGRVGSRAGPDIDRLATLVARAQGRHEIYAAGGVRDLADLAALRRFGAAGVLVASALHDGQLRAADLGSGP
jgi:phosphoribosylformimino-5-aminoimidazole carboxamide ribotide isomerase